MSPDRFYQFNVYKRKENRRSTWLAVPLKGNIHNSITVSNFHKRKSFNCVLNPEMNV